ncbi:hypothetical protein ACFL52_05220, partial [Candidatus Margulisiibacteriota bacterium]
MSNRNKILFALMFFMLWQCKPAFADLTNIEYSKNYLYVLVHGIGDSYKCFDNVYDYMRKPINSGGMGLDGYVYRYQFSRQFGDIMTQGREFGDREYKNRPNRSVDRDSSNDPVDDVYETKNYKSFVQSENNLENYWKLTQRDDGSVNSWLEQVRKDFKAWYAQKKLGKSLGEIDNLASSEIPMPSKFIIIAHSMGGLSVKAYIYGKDSAGNNYYQNDIEKVVYIDTPHLGSGAGKAAIWSEENKASRWIIPLTFTYLGNTYGFWGTPLQKKILAVCTAYSLVSTTSMDVAFNIMNRFKTPGLMDMTPSSPFLNDINNASLDNSCSPIKQKIIIGRGVPTAKNASDAEAWMGNLVVYERIAAALLNAIVESDLETWEEKVFSIYLSSLSGYPFYEDGDLVVTRNSQRGEGLNNLSNAKRFEYLMRSPEFASMMTIADAVFLYSFFLPPPADFWAAVGSIIPPAATFIDNKKPGEYILSHITM